jgi:hypothetical protein
MGNNVTSYIRLSLSVKVLFEQNGCQNTNRTSLILLRTVFEKDSRKLIFQECQRRRNE